ncbi:DUF501 domain-containing protein [Devriesea agamarum]|uniref:DUF501 domain-containing protein n=1 Tax=Devriesea agamarum TaxID=472569 RepID=UPI0009FC9190|nr:DUF501 domain-containing protein [Devriesea agamarum]
MKVQLGRVMRGVHSIARRCACGCPAVVRTVPRLPDGTPFPTSLYLTLPSMVQAISRLEAGGVMSELTERLAHDEDLAAGYRRAHDRYLARRGELGEAREIEGISAGGMPARVKCLHAVVGQSLAEGEGVNPVGDLVLRQLADDGDADIDRCTCDDAQPRSTVMTVQR